MDEKEFAALKATMPWTTRVVRSHTGAVYQIINRNGVEVSIPTMARFLEVITGKLAPKAEQGETAK